jgi:hypothetical protein
MGFRKSAFAGFMLLGTGLVSQAAPPPLDRPSPPPCCADGRAYPNPLTFGWYETRWRRWPIESMASMPGGRLGPTSAQGSDIRPYDPPPPEDEDRRAPPPTTPPEESLRGSATNGVPRSAESRATPNQPSTLTQPPSGTLFPPGPSTEPSGPRRGLPPYEPQGPMPNSRESSGPTSDADPPPILPFGPSMTSAAPPAREAPRQPVSPPAQQAGTREESSGDDPPPSLPGVLAAMTN